MEESNPFMMRGNSTSPKYPDLSVSQFVKDFRRSLSPR
eukprot:CAMPEP_0174293708 /NCGR_PEP_ID=MMETSP0809-20121228/39463_1 /TAXON_ID=73025 ORGANISM="Eutreptiella gymnastica-like, Strain CCMP1594" /NCGR_SAMPLE_ID=MMETSP0809 /ASSEMBLY_ACC=CAM_ASM_000658 /LENGTH=37 /DNA_ID= /DNA_START= /DNA_END= /DNA_ORIENTATION=